MAYKSNFPGAMIVKLGDLVDTNTFEVSVSFNEVAKYAANSDGQIYLALGGISYLMSAAPASHVLSFGVISLTYSDDDARVAVYGSSD